MTRSATEYFQGGGQTTAVDLFDAIFSEIQAHSLNGVTSWETYDTVGTRDVVLRSLGDRTLASGAGDAWLFVRVTWDGTHLLFRAYQDWSTNSHTGSRVSTSASLTLGGAGDFSYWGARNEYEFVVVINRASGLVYSFIGFGSPARNHIDPSNAGVALLTNGVVFGSGVVADVDRDVSSTLAVGQPIWLYRLTPEGSALLSATVEVTTVSAVSDSSVTLATVALSHPAGSVVGFDPCPLYVYTNGSAAYSPNDVNGATTLSHAQDEQDGGIITTANDPAATGFRVGSRAVLRTSSKAVRGQMQHVLLWPPSGLTDEAIVRLNLDDRLLFRVFPSSPTVSSWARSIGPGAPMP